MSEAARRVPIAEGLYTWPSQAPQLIGSRCQKCGEVAFPKQPSCGHCASEDCEELLLSRRGTLWTWTIQSFPPPPPFIGDAEDFAPFGVGYVELPEGIRIESRLTTHDPADLEIGMEMELVVEKFKEGSEGEELMTFAFAPVTA